MAARAASPTSLYAPSLLRSTSAPASRAWLSCARPPNPPCPPRTSSQSSQSSRSRSTAATWRLRRAHARKRCRNVTASGATPLSSSARIISSLILTAASRSPATAHACSSALNACVSTGMSRSRIPASASPAAATSPARAYAERSAVNECRSGSTPLSIMSRIIVSTRTTALCVSRARASKCATTGGLGTAVPSSSVACSGSSYEKEASFSLSLARSSKNGSS